MKFKFNLLAKLTSNQALSRELTQPGLKTPDADKIQQAINNGAKINDATVNGKTPLVACVDKFALLMHEETWHGLSNAISGTDIQPGFYAAHAEGYLNAAKVLIKAGADVQPALKALLAHDPQEVAGIAAVLNEVKPAAPQAKPLQHTL